MPRLLITGASGLLGANLVLAAHDEHDVIAVYYRHPIELEGVQSVSADLCQPGRAKELLDRFQPDWVIHCAANTSIDELEGDPERAFRTNRDMAANVAEAAHGIGAKLVHISTDAVFDGRSGSYREDDPTEPVNVYGESKLAGEQAVQAACPEALIIRTNIFGWNAQPKSSLAEWFIHNLIQGIPCKGFTDVYFNPLLVNHLWAIIDSLNNSDLWGVFHVGSDPCISKYEFGVRLAESFDLNQELISAVEIETGSLRASRPKNTCLDCSKIREVIDVELLGLESNIGFFHELEQLGYVEELRKMAVQ
ncbi:MAG: SDR family oxidoreductase [Chloroflexota bacterium]|nr:SDR family oxidoreductase [Chloroflexota bacterium]